MTSTPKSMEDFVLPEMEEDNPSEKKDKFDPYAVITNQIIEFFKTKSDIDAWGMPWTRTGFPVNAVTGREYNGLNVMILWFAASEYGWEHPYFLTFNQIKSLQAMEQFKDEPIRLRKGSKSKSVCFWKILEKKVKTSDGEFWLDENGEPVVKKIFILRLDQSMTFQRRNVLVCVKERAMCEMRESFPCVATIHLSHPSGRNRRVKINYDGSLDRLLVEVLKMQGRSRRFEFNGSMIDIVTALGQRQTVWVSDTGDYLIDRQDRRIASIVICSYIDNGVH